MLPRKMVEYTNRQGNVEERIFLFLRKSGECAFTLEEILVGISREEQIEVGISYIPSHARMRTALERMIYAKEVERFYAQGRTYYAIANN